MKLILVASGKAYETLMRLRIHPKMAILKIAKDPAQGGQIAPLFHDIKAKTLSWPSDESVMECAKKFTQDEEGFEPVFVPTAAILAQDSAVAARLWERYEDSQMLEMIEVLLSSTKK